MEESQLTYMTCMATGAVITQLNGADFVLYGPIEFAERVFPAYALIDALNTCYGRRMGIKPQVSEHPLVKILEVISVIRLLPLLRYLGLVEALVVAPCAP